MLKYFDDESFVAENPDRAAHEAGVIELLSGTPVPAPDLIAFDADGSVAGAPAVLMSAVAGARTVPVPDPAAAALVLARIHRIDASVPWVFRRYNPAGSAGIPEWGDVALWSEAIAAVAGRPPDPPACFIHRDFHHHNLMWDGSRVAGVIDWLSACIGPPGIDIARFRINTLFDGHPEIGDRFAAAYRDVGVQGAEHPFWDLVDAIDLLPWYSGSEQEVSVWPGKGADVTARSILEGWIARALKSL